jgi:tetratricopeptide (TPR) repeat protein
MQYAYLLEGDCLSKVDEHYNKLTSSTPQLVQPQEAEAEYLMGRFKCGDTSALDRLKAEGGPTQKAFYANILLADYYQSIGENVTALKYFQHRFHHAPDSRRKFFSALSLGDFLAKEGKFDEAVSFLKDQLFYFQESNDQAELWQAIGKVYALCNLNWRKLLCFEKSLKLNPDNTDLRFLLAYGYGETAFGKAMAVHHYQILRTQTPVNSIVANNLSVIYDAAGASVNKISLLRRAQRRKDSAYVSANLATAYAKSGFIADARECLKHVLVGEQQEAIVQAAYRTIQTEIDFDRRICESVDSLVSLQKDLVENKAMSTIIDSDEQLASKFIGTWKLDQETVVTVVMKNGNWASEITTANTHYEHAAYEVTTVYEPGLLQLNADLDEGS